MEMVEKLRADMLQTFLALVADIKSAKEELREIEQRRRDVDAGLNNMKAIAFSMARIMDEQNKRPSDEIVKRVVGNRPFSEGVDHWTYQKLLERVK